MRSGAGALQPKHQGTQRDLGRRQAPQGANVNHALLNLDIFGNSRHATKTNRSVVPMRLVR